MRQLKEFCSLFSEYFIEKKRFYLIKYCIPNGETKREPKYILIKHIISSTVLRFWRNGMGPIPWKTPANKDWSRM